MNKATLLTEIMRLPQEEQWEIFGELLENLPHDLHAASDDEDFVLTAEQEAEIDRRVAEHEKDPSRARPWEEVLADLRSRFK